MSFTPKSSFDWFTPDCDPIGAVKQRYSTDEVVIFKTDDIERFLVRINELWFYGHVNTNPCSVYVDFVEAYPDVSANKAWARRCWQQAMDKTNFARQQYEECINREIEALGKFNTTV